MVKAKYLKGRSFLSVQGRKSDSWLWRAVLKHRDLIKLGACLSVGPNSCINAWEDPWVPFLDGFVPNPLNREVMEQIWLVRDFITPSGEWNSELLKRYFDNISTRERKLEERGSGL
ncbi:hypothetical protein TorRG33x02_303660 [Trema orientale]|uniref:Uncharacterized protein n=1 Tax=Trema orientale TaxID=63057 RepID=A0A2P5BYW6_TREOI|nr:hypothetical protein TorRG33x02_303660 [Trema orientale]